MVSRSRGPITLASRTASSGFRGIHAQLVRVLLASCFVVSSTNAQVLSEGFNPGRIPIFESRIFMVPQRTRGIALSILGTRDFQRLDENGIAKIFPGMAFQDDQMIKKQIDASIAYAKKRESEAADPFFANERPWMLKDASEHRKYADYSRKLNGKLLPYLIRASAYFEGTGGFTANLVGDELEVFHGSLGHSTPPRHVVPVLIFLERRIVRVRVSALIAE